MTNATSNETEINPITRLTLVIAQSPLATAKRNRSTLSDEFHQVQATTLASSSSAFLRSSLLRHAFVSALIHNFAAEEEAG